MNIDSANKPMQQINSGDNKSLSADASDTKKSKNHNLSQSASKTDEIHLSSESKKIQQLQQALKSSDSVDYEKVADVKKRLAEIKLGIQQSGTELESATKKIAGKIIEMDTMFSQK